MMLVGAFIYTSLKLFKGISRWKIKKFEELLSNFYFLYVKKFHVKAPTMQLGMAANTKNGKADLYNRLKK